MKSSIEAPDWSTIPKPADDGAAAHLVSMPLPSVSLSATDGTTVDLSALHGRVIVYAYPRTGVPGVENPPGWDLIPGARGCSPQSCAFRDHFAELKTLGVDHLFGLSTQDTAYQREAAVRLHLPFPILSDQRLEPHEFLAPADVPDQRDDLTEAADSSDPRRKNRTRVLPGFPSRSKCQRSDRVAGRQGPVIESA